MSDAAIDAFADAFVARVSRVFEDDQIRLAVAAAMAKLAKDVRAMEPISVRPTAREGWAFVAAKARVLALIEKATP